MSSTVEDLHATLNILSGPGVWVQGPFRRSVQKHSHCLLTAMNKVADNSDERLNTMISELCQTLGLSSDYIGRMIFDTAEWNDTPGRTLEEVLGALQTTIQRLEVR